MGRGADYLDTSWVKHWGCLFPETRNQHRAQGEESTGRFWWDQGTSWSETRIVKGKCFIFLVKLKWYLWDGIHSQKENSNISLIGHHSILKISSVWLLWEGKTYLEERWINLYNYQMSVKHAGHYHGFKNISDMWKYKKTRLRCLTLTFNCFQMKPPFPAKIMSLSFSAFLPQTSQTQ